MPNNFNCFLEADWPAPPNVRAFSTLRSGGVSEGPYASLNLGMKGGDDLAKVFQNREILKIKASLPESPLWLTQVHGNNAVVLGAESLPLGPGPGPEADAALSFTANRVCAVLTADCLPILLCDAKGTRVAAIHAGWKGIREGVIESTVAKLDCSPASLLAWFGPAIGPTAYEVREDMREEFKLPEDKQAFETIGPGHYKANIYQLAENRLKKLGVKNIYGGGFCTFNETDRFFSYRRSKQTGHMGSLIWLTQA